MSGGAVDPDGEAGRKIKCPRCGSTSTSPFQGGARFRCNGCGRAIATPPSFYTKSGVRDYRQAVKEVRFTVGGYDTGYPEVRMRKTAQGIGLAVRPGHAQADCFLQREMSVDEWAAVMDTLFCKLYLHEWKKRFMDPDIMDGEQWELVLELQGARRRTYSGSNAYPPYWEQLRAVFQSFFNEAEIAF